MNCSQKPPAHPIAWRDNPYSAREWLRCKSPARSRGQQPLSRPAQRAGFTRQVLPGCVPTQRPGPPACLGGQRPTANVSPQVEIRTQHAGNQHLQRSQPIVNRPGVVPDRQKPQVELVSPFEHHRQYPGQNHSIAEGIMRPLLGDTPVVRRERLESRNIRSPGLTARP